MFNNFTAINFSNDDEDETPKTKNITDNRFYGPANSCVEIAKLGYTLNGYYLVKGNTTTNSQIQVLGCKFKHFDRSKEGNAVWKRIIREIY